MAKSDHYRRDKFSLFRHEEDKLFLPWYTCLVCKQSPPLTLTINVLSRRRTFPCWGINPFPSFLHAFSTKHSMAALVSAKSFRNKFQDPQNHSKDLGSWGDCLVNGELWQESRRAHPHGHHASQNSKLLDWLHAPLFRELQREHTSLWS